MYQRHLRPNDIQKGFIASIYFGQIWQRETIWSGLNIIKFIFGEVSEVVSRTNKPGGHKGSPQNKLLELFTPIVWEHQSSRSSKVGWPNPSTSDIRAHEEPILLNVNNIQDIFGMISKTSLWKKHMQKQKYCCWAQNRGLFADIDVLAEKQIQYING